MGREKWIGAAVVAGGLLWLLKGRAGAGELPGYAAPHLETDADGQTWYVTPTAGGDWFTPVCPPGANTLPGPVTGPDGRVWSGQFCLRTAPGVAPELTPGQIAAAEENRAAREADRIAREAQALADQFGMTPEQQAVLITVSREGSPSNMAARITRMGEIGALVPLPEPRRGAFFSQWSAAVRALVASGLSKWDGFDAWERAQLFRDWRSLSRTLINERWARLPGLGYGRSPIAFNAFVARWRPPVRLSLGVLTDGIRLARVREARVFL
jgi:hypothetical protein